MKLLLIIFLVVACKTKIQEEISPKNNGNNTLRSQQESLSTNIDEDSVLKDLKLLYILKENDELNLSSQENKKDTQLLIFGALSAVATVTIANIPFKRRVKPVQSPTIKKPRILTPELKTHVNEQLSFNKPPQSPPKTDIPTKTAPATTIKIQKKHLKISSSDDDFLDVSIVDSADQIDLVVGKPTYVAFKGSEPDFKNSFESDIAITKKYENENFTIFELRKPVPTDSFGIVGGGGLPKIGTDEVLKKSVRNTRPIHEFDGEIDASLLRGLKIDGVVAVTQVRGDGNCGFYSLYTANRLQKGLPIEGAEAIAQWVKKTKVATTQKLNKKLVSLKGQQLENLKLEVSLSIAGELLDMKRKLRGASSNRNALEDAKLTILELKRDGVSTPEFEARLLKDAEIDQFDARRVLEYEAELDKLLRELNYREGSDLYEFAENIKNRPNLGDLYGTWIVERSGTKVDSVGLQIIAEEILDRPIIGRTKEAPDDLISFDSVTPGQTPIFMINTGGHWDLGHLTPENMHAMLFKRIKRQEENWRKSSGKTKEIEKEKLEKLKYDFEIWLSQNQVYL